MIFLTLALMGATATCFHLYLYSKNKNEELELEVERRLAAEEKIKADFSEMESGLSKIMNDCSKFHQLYGKLNEIAKQFHQMYRPEYGLGEISICLDRGLFYFYLDRDPTHGCRWMTMSQKYMRIGLPLKLLDENNHGIYRHLFDKAVCLTQDDP